MSSLRQRVDADISTVIRWVPDERALYLFTGPWLVWPLTVDQSQRDPTWSRDSPEGPLTPRSSRTSAERALPAIAILMQRFGWQRT